jgi:hypothetical protein
MNIQWLSQLTEKLNGHVAGRATGYTQTLQAGRVLLKALITLKREFKLLKCFSFGIGAEVGKKSTMTNFSLLS